MHNINSSKIFENNELIKKITIVIMNSEKIITIKEKLRA